MRKVRILISVIFLVFCFWTVSDSAPTRYKFISADMTVPINTTYVEGTDFISKQIMLAYTKNDASITFYVKGNNAGCSKDVIFKFATFDSLRNKWDTADVLNEGLGVSITANGTTAVQKTIAIEADLERLKLLSVQNQETISGYTVDVNVSIFIK